MKRFLIVLCLLCTSCTATGLLFDGGLLKRNGIQYHWLSEDFPIQIVVSSNLNSITVDRVRRAVYYWNVMIEREVFVVVDAPFDSSMFSGYCGVIQVYQRNIRTEYPTQSKTCDAYFTQLVVDPTGHMCSGVIVVDDIMVGDIADEWLLLVLIHELGHGLMLAHDGDKNSIMYPIVRDMYNDKFIQHIDIYRVQRVIDSH